MLNVVNISLRVDEKLTSCHVLLRKCVDVILTRSGINCKLLKLAHCASDVGINWNNNIVNWTFKLQHLCTDRATQRSLASDHLTKLLCGFLTTPWLLQNPPVSSSRFCITTVFNVCLKLTLLHYLISLPYLTQQNAVTLNTSSVLSTLEWCVQRGHYIKWFYCNGAITLHGPANT